jgi:signal transduction histidine kinase/ligand-binding sensor domain-containing protein
MAGGLLMLLVAFRGEAQELVPQDQVPFLFRTWQTAEGLPHNTVGALMQTPDGYLWLGTHGGLAQFDGVNCRVFGLSDGLRNLQISKLLYDRDGSIWIGTIGGGLSRLQRGRVESWTTAEGLAGDAVMALAQDREGTVWVGTTTGLSRWRGGSFLPPLTQTNLLYIRDMVLDHDGAVWISTLHQGLFQFRDGKFVSIPGPPEQRVIWADSLLVDRQNRVWAGTVFGTVLCRETNAWRSYPVAGGGDKTVLQELAETADGTVWVGTMDEGVHYLKDGEFIALREPEGLASDAVESLLVDQDQNVWVGMRGGGLSQLRPRRLQTCRVEENGVGRFPITLAQTLDGRIWAGTYGRGLFWWNGTNFEQFLRTMPISGHFNIEAVLAGRDGSLWWGAGPALYQWKDGKLGMSVDGSWLRGDRVLSFCEDVREGMWVGTRHGQLRHLLARGTGSFTTTVFKSGPPVTSLVQETNGTLWAGTLGGGLIRIQGTNQTVFNVEHGLGSDSILTLMLDGDGVLWIGTASGGLVRRKDGSFTAFTARHGLMDDSISQVLEDGRGNLWLGCDRGIMRVARAELEAVADGREQMLHPVFMGRREGMLAEQCTIGFGTAIQTHGGKLLFCTPKGIVIADPAQEPPKAPAPAVLIQDVLVDGVVRSGQFNLAPAPAGEQTTAEIEPGRKMFEFHFTGLSFDAPERVRFRYQLKGLDDAWVDAGRNRLAAYANLAPGQYEFHVLAGNADGVWSAAPAVVRFTVLPQFWQQGWFAASAVLVSLGITALVIRGLERRRYRRRLQRLEAEKAMENERARIARDLHDELGSSLTRISMLGDQLQTRAGNPEQTKALAAKLTGFSVRTTQAFEEIVWAVNPRHDSLRSLLEYLTHCARELFEDTGVTCRFQIPSDLPDVVLPPDTRHSLFLVVKEALTNALKHSGAKRVCLQAQLNDGALEIRVQDDGHGFDASAPAPDGEHDGVQNMRQRIGDLGGAFTVESAPGLGTTICVTVSRDRLGVAEHPAHPR